VVSTFLAGKTLNYYFGIFIYENAHRFYYVCAKLKLFVVISKSIKRE